jgi:hypothetical protein
MTLTRSLSKLNSQTRPDLQVQEEEIQRFLERKFRRFTTQF